MCAIMIMSGGQDVKLGRLGNTGDSGRCPSRESQDGV